MRLHLHRHPNLCFNVGSDGSHCNVSLTGVDEGGGGRSEESGGREVAGGSWGGGGTSN